MANVAKYFLLLESLNFGDGSKEDERLEDNLGILQKFITLSSEEIIAALFIKLRAQYLEGKIDVSNCDANACETYTAYMLYTILEIMDNVNFDSDAKKDLISTRHMNLCIEAVQDLSAVSLRRHLNGMFYKSPVYAEESKRVIDCKKPNYGFVSLTIEGFSEILKVKQFHVAKSMELVLRDYMAGIFTLILGSATKEWPLEEVNLQQLHEKLNYIWRELTKLEYFRNIMLFKGIPNLCVDLQRELHKELLKRLLSKDGFTTLVATLQTAHHVRQKTSAMVDDKRTFEIVSNIVAFRGHTPRAQNELIREIFHFLKLCLTNESMQDSMGAGLLSLRRLYDLNDNNKEMIKETIKSSLLKLIQPPDLLNGLILMEHKEFSSLIALMYHLFCTSYVECLPSELLVMYLPLLFQIYHNIPEAFVQKKQIGSLILRCLNNRKKEELDVIIEKLYTLSFDAGWLLLHPRIIIFPNIEQTEMSLKITSSEYKPEFNLSLALPEILITGEHNILTYRIFMSLLNLISQNLNENPAEAIELLQTEDELVAFLNSNYPVKVEILLSLNDLICHPPLKSQISENATEFLHFLRVLIESRLESSTINTEATDQTLLIMLTLAQEMLEHSQMPKQFYDFLPTLRKLQTCTPNQLVHQRINSLIALLEGENQQTSIDTDATNFNKARSLIESKESHLQVYGIQLFLDLLRRRDVVTLGNGHVMIALALDTLKERESYTFLNCVRLFVALVNVMEAEVLEVLSDEYLNDKANIDYKLVVGEAILKVSQELGPLCYKYKAVLFNCFLHGARSTLNEFRMSAFVNLGHLARILCFQVQHFFQELLHLIDCELTTGNYLPAKRAAVLVLTEILEGMDNLVDFEDMLLPIYRLLRDIEAAENVDEKMRVHASNGLKILNEKCKKLLFPERQLQKEIQIFGIKEKLKGKAQNHILEMN